MRNLLLTIAYDGTGFSGWQRQPSVRTVQGDLEQVLSQLTGQKIQINGTSRTDAGVHALGQRASFKGQFGIPTDRIELAANNLLSGSKSSGKPGDVQILAVEEVEPDFHARFSCLGKKYIYRISNVEKADIFRRNYCYHVAQPLDISAMQEGAAHFTGRQDYRCFMASGGQEMESTVRTIFTLDVRKEKEEDGRAGFGDVIIEITGDGFLYNMVRIITGTLVEMGLGKRRPEEGRAIVASAQREKAGHTAPPQGLYLAEIYYERQPFMDSGENSQG